MIKSPHTDGMVAHRPVGIFDLGLWGNSKKFLPKSCNTDRRMSHIHNFFYQSYHQTWILDLFVLSARLQIPSVSDYIIYLFSLVPHRVWHTVGIQIVKGNGISEWPWDYTISYFWLFDSCLNPVLAPHQFYQLYKI